jgi:hypothetical protein
MLLIFTEAIGFYDQERMQLSQRNESFACTSQLKLQYKNRTDDNLTYTVSQTMTNLRVQAFDLVNDK